MPATLTPQAFAAQWRNVRLKQRSAAQAQCLDRWQLSGHPMPGDKRSGTPFAFAKGVDQLGGDPREGVRAWSNF